MFGTTTTRSSAVAHESYDAFAQSDDTTYMLYISVSVPFPSFVSFAVSPGIFALRA
ncbi:hypothetical protein BD410DRAFT_783345 [Rickenella mellea]|uniref:Uncharacterized protein n=1 Tax=Rickenella mellea TaxID=50990 RepID=A0A4Y7QJ68_9AGAM|nr:hypothetical protein BD410DRAFT_783345 [Rickenella mellea]